MVAVPESHLMGQLIYIDAAAFVAYICFAPSGKYSGICEDGEYEIEKHASGHHQQPLPCRLAAEFPRLRVAFELLCVKGFVYHSCNLAVSSQREPAYAVFGVQFLCLRKEPCKPPLLGAEQLESGIARIEE